MTLLTLLNMTTSAREVRKASIVHMSLMILSCPTKRQSSPSAKEATLLDIWLNTCLSFNLAAVFEYAALLYKKSNLRGKSDDSPSLVDLESFNKFGKRVDMMFCAGLLVLFSLVTMAFVAVTFIRSMI